MGKYKPGATPEQIAEHEAATVKLRLFLWDWASRAADHDKECTEEECGGVVFPEVVRFFPHDPCERANHMEMQIYLTTAVELLADIVKQTGIDLTQAVQLFVTQRREQAESN